MVMDVFTWIAFEKGLHPYDTIQAYWGGVRVELWADDQPIDWFPEDDE